MLVWILKRNALENTSLCSELIFLILTIGPILGCLILRLNMKFGIYKHFPKDWLNPGKRNVGFNFLELDLSKCDLRYCNSISSLVFGTRLEVMD